MIVDPYKRNPAPPLAALLVRDDVAGFAVVDERGRRLDLDALPPTARVWGAYDLVHELTAEGHGEALCWNNEEIRWRHRRLDREGWTNRQSDVSVIKLPLPDDHRDTLRGLAGWRDWLARYGAAPTGTTGSAAWSLLRATLEDRLWTTVGHPPPLRWTLGGRQELGPAGAGRFPGPVDHFDMPAAYANELGHLPYGGFWQTAGDLPVEREPAWWASEGRPVFVRAIVKVPPLEYGPLPRRPRKRITGLGAAIFPAEYPTGGRLQGVWTWQELEQAERVGCSIVRVLDLWVHLASTLPFLPWWDALQDGRAMPGLAGVLAKMTGNALVGRFSMDSTGGERAIRGKSRGALRQRPAPVRGGVPPAHDLAETITGRTRARLHAAITSAGAGLVSAHTDGIWATAAKCPTYWRHDKRARVLDVLDPQVLRYWPERSRDERPHVVFAGMPAEYAEERFEELWRAAGFPE